MSKMAFDYSKWDNIEISDDEADCHPNIDKASWFRMKHRSRVEREDTEAADRKSMEAENRADVTRYILMLRVYHPELTAAEPTTEPAANPRESTKVHLCRPASSVGAPGPPWGCRRSGDFPWPPRAPRSAAWRGRAASRAAPGTCRPSGRPPPRWRRGA